jgi:anti-sigma factor RsiW
MSQFNKEHLTAYLDGVLDTATQHEVEQQLKIDSVLAHEYQCLHTVKHLLLSRQAQLRRPAPASVRHSVMLKLDQEFVRSTNLASIQEHEALHEGSLAPVSKHQKATKPVNPRINLPKTGMPKANVYNLQQFTHNFWERRNFLVAAVVVFALGFGAIRYMVRSAQPVKSQQAQQFASTESASLVESTLVRDALRNHEAVTSGKITLQHATSSFDDLDQFFRTNGIAFHLVRPRIADTKLLGGVVSEENGRKSAHLVFAHKDTLLYMWEIEETPATIRHAAIKPEAWQILQTGEWLWNTSASKAATVVFWEDETDKPHRTLCAIVSAMPRSELQPLFQ